MNGFALRLVLKQRQKASRKWPVTVIIKNNLQPRPACSYKDLKLDRSLKAKWQEKSELIGRLEKEVVEMRNNFNEKEKTLTEERDKAIQAAR